MNGRVSQAWSRPTVSSTAQRSANYVLNAPGTPMMRPLEEDSSLARLTLLAGEPSVRSRFGIESPALTKAGRVEWKVLAAEMQDERAARVRGRREDRNAMMRGSSLFVCG